MEKLLDKINSPADVKKLPASKLDALAMQVRRYLVDVVSSCGGHLSSNLGVVELTIALCRCLDLPKDKIIWDVGHQSYVYKMFTGRREAMKKLRTLEGCGGFSSPEESEYDFTVSGHSSTSLSSALGAAMAQKVTHTDSKICCVIGDGALTGGLALEALENIGQAKEPMLIVLNDNEMSISKNVGSISALLSKARTGEGYKKAKVRVENVLNKIPYWGDKLSSAAKNVKEHLKYAITAGTFFESMGITYLGSVDGHSIEDMCEIFSRALLMDTPVLVHVMTKKGKGYSFAETEPHKYHGTNAFDKNKGVEESNAKTYSSVFGSELCALAERNEKIVAITPSMTLGSGLAEFEKRFPERFYDVGIAEGHSVTFGGGLATFGAVSVVAVYSSFLQRACDSVIHDLAIGNNHSVLAIDRAGLVPGDGATHQGVFDVAMLSMVPNLCILSPSSFSELRKMLRYSIEQHNGPIAVRYPRGGEKMSIDNGEFVLGKASVLRVGDGVTIVSYGSMVHRALKCADELEKRGISAEVIDLRTIKPIDEEAVIKSVLKTGKAVVMEEVVRRGGIGEQLAGILCEKGIGAKIKIIALPDEFMPHATADELEEYCGFTTNGLIKAMEDIL